MSDTSPRCESTLPSKSNPPPLDEIPRRVSASPNKSNPTTPDASPRRASASPIKSNPQFSQDVSPRPPLNGSPRRTPSSPMKSDPSSPRITNPFTAPPVSKVPHKQHFLEWAERWARDKAEISKEDVVVDLPEIITILRFLGYKITKCELLDKSAEVFPLKDNEEGARIVLTCGHSGQRFVLEQPSLQDECGCFEKKNSSNDNGYFELTADPNDREMQALVDVGCPLIPHFFGEQEKVIHRIIQYLARHLLRVDYKKPCQSREKAPPSPSKHFGFTATRYKSLDNLDEDNFFQTKLRRNNVVSSSHPDLQEVAYESYLEDGAFREPHVNVTNLIANANSLLQKALHIMSTTLQGSKNTVNIGLLGSLNVAAGRQENIGVDVFDETAACQENIGLNDEAKERQQNVTSSVLDDTAGRKENVTSNVLDDTAGRKENVTLNVFDDSVLCKANVNPKVLLDEAAGGQENVALKRVTSKSTIKKAPPRPTRKSTSCINLETKSTEEGTTSTPTTPRIAQRKLDRKYAHVKSTVSKITDFKKK